MMPGAEAKIILMLAATDLTSSEIRLFLREVERNGISDIIKRIDNLRSIAGETGSSPSRSSFHSARESEQRNILDQVENLLLREARLPKSRATHILYSELGKEFGEEYYLPSPNKIAFRLWLSRLLDQVPPSTVLHVASRLRNSIVHGTKSLSDWPLDTKRN